MALSSAFFGFFGHTGFVRALQDAGIRPVLYGGASAGAMVAAAAAAGRLEQFGDVALDLKRRDFWDPGVPFGAPPGLLRGRRFAALLERHLPARFDDCATPLVTVSTNLTRRRRHVDTTGALPEAVLASSASPILFKPVRRGGELHVDGGLVDRPRARRRLAPSGGAGRGARGRGSGPGGADRPAEPVLAGRGAGRDGGGGADDGGLARRARPAQ